MVRATVFRRSLCVVSLALLTASAAIGCAVPAPKAPIPKRPIEEGRAERIIGQSIQKEGLEPGPPRTITYGGKMIVLDVTINHRRLGIAYLTPMDVDNLGHSSLAYSKNEQGDPLRIETVSDADGEMHFVVLYATDYSYDDTEGAQHEATVITAENKLDRDVRDFINIAARMHFE